MEPDFEKTIIRVETNESIVAHNLEMMKTEMRELSAIESMGGNAGVREIGGIRYSCLALNGYAEKETGKILAFGNFQNISLEIQEKGIQFTLIEAINIEKRIIKLIDFLNSDKFSEKGRENINQAALQYNEIYNPKRE